MNSKILLAFLGGAVLASGIVYMAVKPTAPGNRTYAAVKSIYVNPVNPSMPSAADQVTPEQVGAAVVSTESAAPLRELPGDHVAESKTPYKPEKRSPSGAARPAGVAHVIQPRIPADINKPVTSDPPVVSPPPIPEPSQPVVEPLRDPPQPEPLPPPVRQPHTVTLNSGTAIAVRIGETLTADHNQPGDGFLATLDQPLVVDGFVIAERGARLEGRIVEADRGGRVKGTSRLEIELVKLATADGQHVRIRTSPFAKQSESSIRSDAAKIGIGAAIGAAIGGIASGGKGAGIGAGVGGAAGAGDVLLTRGKAAAIPVETRVSFHLQEPLTLTERLR